MYPLATRPNVRLAELLGVLSLGTDVGLGQPMEHALRRCVIALRLSDRFEVEPQARSTIYYTALLMNVGVPASADERATGRLPPHRPLQQILRERLSITCDLARRLRLPNDVIEAVAASHERWDGHGAPNRLSGLAIPSAARFVQLAEVAEVGHRDGGTRATVDLVRRGSGRQFDPRLCAAFVDEPDVFLDGLDDKPAWQFVVDEQPTLAIYLTAVQFDAALHMIADLIDVRSHYMFGHSRAVAQLAAAAGDHLRMDLDDIDQLYRAGLVHDLGRLGVSNAIWHKKGVLTAGERATLRTYPALSARILSSAPALKDLGELAAQHRERLDGSGYPDGLSGRRVGHDARVLAAADAYRSMRESRPHRIAYTREETAIRMRAEARAGRLDGHAAEAVLAVARGGTAAARDDTLSVDELDVLRLLVRGLRPREIARELRTGQRVVERRMSSMYAKTHATGRATASLFAMSHGLVGES